ncbi:MAG: tyrosine-protein phosphatase [Myxococcaceae bacterium]
MKKIFFIALFILGVLIYTNKIGDNFHEVSKSKFYRSALMSADNLSERIRKNHIKLVFNLIGEARADWYDDEVEATEKAGAQHESISLSATHLPEPEKLEQIFKRFEAGPYPMLIHCHGGSDRSGLVSVLYLMVVEKKPLDEALSQLSLHYGHFSVGGTKAMDDFFELYRKTNHGQDIATWSRTTYATLLYSSTSPV